ncbi:MAG: class II fructose-bisphosphate aldolase [Candidatus Borkfalkiaceae bacterium]|nr:class II fructose-bisphosphate aldolase [Clostridia bacterium]MDY6223330.1 class II fructose-bisphosphate aldolase [Christensenellaceae bacterium]
MLASLKEVVAEGKKRSIAIGSFNTPNLECLLAVLDAAETLDVPVIIAHAQCHEDVAPLDKIGPVMVELAKRSKVKVCVHLDHGEDFEYCKRAIELGFTSVMIDYSTLPYEENAKGTREVVDFAHSRGVDVEAELGALPQREGGTGEVATNPEDLYTKPALVPDFLEKTNVDALAIAFGTAHGIYKTKPVLNMDIITKVREYTDLPLVMHGGSGISHEEYREVIRRGVGKINYYSYMAYAGYAAAKKTVEGKEADFFHNLALNAQQAMYENALATLKVFSGE